MEASEESPLEPVVRLWMLRVLVAMRALRRFIRESAAEERVLQSLGVDVELLLGQPVEGRLAMAMKTLQPIWEREEQRRAALPDVLGSNLDRLARLLGLSEVETEILGFAVMLHTVSDLDDVVDALGCMAPAKAYGVLAKILGLPEASVKRALQPAGHLARCGLLSLGSNSYSTLSRKIELLSGPFADAIQAEHLEPVDVLRGVVERAPAAHLSLADYPHVQDRIRVLRSYVVRALETARQGVNILVWGPPGTGKTELARALAADIGCALFEVATLDDMERPMSGHARLNAFRAAQRFLQGVHAVLLFDEVEDVFDTSRKRAGTEGEPHKGAMNRILESNAIPALWLSNDVRCMDPAFTRRFDLVLEMPVPSRQVREAIIRRSCASFVDPGTVATLAEADALAPAVLTRAARVLRMVHEDIPREEAGPTLLRMVSSTLQAQGHAEIHVAGASVLPDLYALEFMHVDVELEDLVQGVSRAGSARLCLYGPPGTGKSAFARYLARRLDRPLRVRRASDLLSRWVGAAEKNIAAAFREAQADRAVLLLDEVDSFLQERRGAQHVWELTQVNEMLTQLEAFDGVLVATTNLIEGLDPAAMRRFDLKARFHALRADQVWALLCRHCQSSGIPTPTEALRPAVAALRGLTPGDFAAIARRGRFQPVGSAEAWIEALRAECQLKAGGQGVMGFL